MIRNKRKFHYLSNIFALALMFLLFSCVEGAGRGGGSVKDFSKSDVTTSTCEDLFLVVQEGEDDSCQSSCPDGTIQATATEIDELRNIRTDLSSTIDQAIGVCIDGQPEVRRPEGVSVQRDFCSCLNSRSDMINNCDAFCSTTATEEPTLFVNTAISPDIQFNSELGSLERWCNAVIPNDVNPGTPQCFLQAVAESGSVTTIDVALDAGSNSFRANIGSLSLDQTFIARIVETGSGSNLSSNEFQIRRRAPSTGETNNTPLKIMPVNQYSCVIRSGSTGPDGDEFENAIRLHFYFPNDNEPQPMPPGDNFQICHDINTFGPNDRAGIPRLELVPQHLSFWDQTDSRFVDGDSDGTPDINNTIQDRLRTEFGVSSTQNYFTSIRFRNRPGSDGTEPIIGVMMIPFLDNQTGRGKCPDQNDYNGSDPQFQVLKDIVGVSTEALYISEKEPEILTDEDGNVQNAPDDFILIRENQVNKIWFYFEDGNKVKPNEETAGQRTVHFFWPPDENEPFIQKDNQKLYTVRAPENLGGVDRTQFATSARPPDKRLGCVPEQSL